MSVPVRTATAADVMSLWRSAGPDRWFEKDNAFDDAIRSKFLPAYEAGVRGELAAWANDAEGALSLVIVFDQFPRNMFRAAARAFASDPLARAVADRAIARGFDQATEQTLRQFFYLPFMHSEALADQDRALRLYEALGNDDSLKYARIHRDIIVRFGRFPHRNQFLNRPSTPAELEFLKEGGFAG
jgi:uncharacterized protein (DUF924 family)